MKHRSIFESTGGHCWYCGTRLDPNGGHGAGGSNTYVLDHAIPRCQGGPSTPANYVPSCRTCNSRKSGRTIEEYRTYYRFKAAGIRPFPEWVIAELDQLGIDVRERLPGYLFWAEKIGAIEKRGEGSLWANKW